MDDKEIVEVQITYRDRETETFYSKNGYRIVVKVAYVSEVQPDID